MKPIRPLPISLSRAYELYMSGYTDKALDPDGGLPLGAAFLQKPITPPALASAVRRLLDALLQNKSQIA